MNEIKKLITAQDFHDYFESIDEKYWIQDKLEVRRKLKDIGNFTCGCALYHLGTRNLSNYKGLVEADSYTGYGYLDYLSKENVYRLGKLLNKDSFNFDDSDAQTIILSKNDSLDYANEILNLPEDYNLLDIKPLQQGKVAKANMLKALKELM